MEFRSSLPNCMPIDSDLVQQQTADGSFTFFSREFGETFHSHHGAYQEALHKFVYPTEIISKASQPTLRILDICYGLGYNTAAALEAIWTANPACRVELIGLELNPIVPQAAVAQQLLNPWPSPIQALLTTLAHESEVQVPHLAARLIWGDARMTLQAVVQEGFVADAIFLDPFSPPHCPQLWTIEFLALAARCLQRKGRLATYSCAAAVRSALVAAGLTVGATPPVGRRAPGTLAWLPSAPTPTLALPLSPQEQEHLLTRAAVPYRDPNLDYSATVILEQRQQEQAVCNLEPTSHWKKRWLL